MSGNVSSGASNSNGQFHTENGTIRDPNGNSFTAEGINVYDSQMGAASQILSDFPGVNFVRLNVFNYQSPSAYSSFIQTMTSHGVVVELEDHTNSNGSNNGGGAGAAFSGSQLSDELNWYSSVASAYASNPYVWFGTDNEPPGGGLSTWQQQTYNAIRNAGNNSPILMEMSGAPKGTISDSGMDPSVYASMSNIIADAHFYGWNAGYSTDQQTVDSSVSDVVRWAQSMHSASGTVPVIIGEYGISTNGSSDDANSSQVLKAVQQATQSGQTAGAVAWGWDTGATDNLTTGSGNLTSYGQELAQWISSTAKSPASGSAASTSTSTSSSANSTTGAATTPSTNDTVVTAGSSAAITDASGNQWTITNGGQVAVNGSPDSTTAHVSELAYVNGEVWQESSNNLWWGKTSPTAAWSPTNGTASSPLPAQGAIAPTSTNTTVDQSGISVAATSGTNMMFISGSNDTVDLSGGTHTVTDTGSGNTYILPAAGNGTVSFTNDILTESDTLNLKTALAATDWNGSASTLPNYLTVSNSSQGAVVSIAPTSGGAGTGIATITGASNVDLNTLLAHSVT